MLFFPSLVFLLNISRSGSLRSPVLIEQVDSLSDTYAPANCTSGTPVKSNVLASQQARKQQNRKLKSEVKSGGGPKLNVRLRASQAEA